MRLVAVVTFAMASHCVVLGDFQNDDQQLYVRVGDEWKAVWVEGGEDFIPVKRWSKDRVAIKRHNGTVHSTPTCRIVELTYTVLHTDSPLTHWPTSVFSHIAFHIT